MSLYSELLSIVTHLISYVLSVFLPLSIDWLIVDKYVDHIFLWLSDLSASSVPDEGYYTRRPH